MARLSSLVPLIPLGGQATGSPSSGLSMPTVHADAAEWLPLDDPRLIEIMAMGFGSGSGITVSVERAMRVPAVFRSLALISETMGMLPLHLREKGSKEKATKHPLFKVLHRKPNDFQSAYEFRTLMQLRALVKGNAYALIVRAGNKVVALLPLNPDFVTPKLRDDWTVVYEYRPEKGAYRVFAADEILHIRNLPDIRQNGLVGISMVKQAADAIGIALAQDLAIGRLFKNGSFIPGVLKTDRELSPTTAKRLSEDWQSAFGGAANAGRTPVLEQGLDYKEIGRSARDTQAIELRRHQIEEIARIFGVPRPLLMMDDTSWGSGIGVLGQFFVRHALNPWFDAWQQSIQNVLLTDEEAEQYEVRFNAGVLLRGSMTEQGDFLAKMRGAGGQQPIFTANEAREYLDMPAREDGNSLENPMTSNGQAPAPGKDT